MRACGVQDMIERQTMMMSVMDGTTQAQPATPLKSP